MNDNEVISTMERVDRVLADFSRQVGAYADGMGEQLSALSAAVAGLGTGWESEDYDRFAESMNQKLARIQAELQATGKLKEYLEQVAQEFGAYLDQLKAAANDE